MTPTAVMLDALQTLLATDASTLAPVANGVAVSLIKADFTPSALTDFTTLTEADFTGSAFKSATPGAQQSFVDPVTGLRIVQMSEPVGGWHWQATNTANLPQSIYGWVVTNHARTVTYGSQKFPTPVQILAAGNGVDIDQVRFAMPGNALK